MQGFFQGLKKHIEANNLLNATATNSTAGATVDMSMAEALFDDATANSTREEPDSTSKIEKKKKKKKHKKKRKSNEAGKEEIFPASLSRTRSHPNLVTKWWRQPQKKVQTPFRQ